MRDENGFIGGVYVIHKYIENEFDCEMVFLSSLQAKISFLERCKEIILDNKEIYWATWENNFYTKKLIKSLVDYVSNVYVWAENFTDVEFAPKLDTGEAINTSGNGCIYFNGVYFQWFDFEYYDLLFAHKIARKYKSPYLSFIVILII